MKEMPTPPKGWRLVTRGKVRESDKVWCSRADGNGHAWRLTMVPGETIGQGYAEGCIYIRKVSRPVRRKGKRGSK